MESWTAEWCTIGCSARNLHTMTPDGSDITPLTRFLGEGQLGADGTFLSAERPRWTSDGSRVFFTVRGSCRGDPTCPGDPATARVVQLAFIGADGSGLELLPMSGVQHAVLRPVDD